MAHTLSAHTWRRCANDAATPSKGGRAGVLCTTSINTRWLARKVCVCLCVGTDFKLAEQLSDPQKGVCVSSESLLKVCAYILHSHSHKCVMLTRTRTQMSVTFWASLRFFPVVLATHANGTKGGHRCCHLRCRRRSRRRPCWRPIAVCYLAAAPETACWKCARCSWAYHIFGHNGVSVPNGWNSVDGFCVSEEVAW